MTQEALKLALEAFHQIFNTTPVYHNDGTCVINDKSVEVSNKAIIAIKEALTQPEQVIQDSTCSITLRLQGKPYPRTCKKCGMGPCIAQPTAQLEQEHDTSSTHLAHCYQGEYPVCKYGDENCPATPKVKTQPEQKPAGNSYLLADKVREALDRKACPDAFMRIAYESIIKNYTHPPQRTWVALTDEQIEHLWETRVGQPCPSYPLEKSDWVQFARAIEAAHGIKEKNT